MLKKYTATSQIGINAVFENNKYKHIVFNAITGGISVFYTSDESLQKAIETNSNYGILFSGEEVIEPVEMAVEILEDTNSKLTPVVVTCVDDAKDYLSEKFGISRTKIRSVKAIIDVAKANGVEFQGL